MTLAPHTDLVSAFERGQGLIDALVCFPDAAPCAADDSFERPRTPTPGPFVYLWYTSDRDVNPCLTRERFRTILIDLGVWGSILVREKRIIGLSAPSIC